MATTRRRRQTAPAVTPGSRPTAITKLADHQSYFNWLIYGETGAGKTVLGGTAPKALFLTFEPEGTESAKVFGSTAEQLPVHEKVKLDEAYDYFDLGTGCDDYEWAIIDSVSEMEECFWRDHLREQKERKPDTRSLYKPSLDDYQPVWNKVKAEVDRWNRLPINVLYTAQVLPFESVDDEGDELVTLLPLLGSLKNGVLARKVSGMVSMVGYLDVKSKKVDDKIEEWRRLYVSKREGISAKNRYGWGRWVDNPTIPSLAVAATSALAGNAQKRTSGTAARRRRTA
jgi:AAA domain